MSKIKWEFPHLDALILKGFIQNQQRLLLPPVILCEVAPRLSINITNFWTDWSIFVMAVILFLLGRPGSGKSTAARYIEHLALQHGWSVLLLNDYKVLQAMFHADTDHKQFHPVGPPEAEAFDVIDFTVLDTALKQIEQEARDYLNDEHTLILIEFARDEYRKPLKLFECDFLRHAYFLYFEANLDICIQRIRDRALYPATKDDHLVSEDILRNYYFKDNVYYMGSVLVRDFPIEEHRVAVIENNTGSLEAVGIQVKAFIDPVIVSKVPISKDVDRIPTATSGRGTDPLIKRDFSPDVAVKENPVELEKTAV